MTNLSDNSARTQVRSRCPVVTREPHRSGVTLIELVITVLVVGVLVSTAVPRYAAQLQNRQLSSAVERIVADLESLRQRAVFTSSTQSVVFDATSDSYSLNPSSSSGTTGGRRTVILNESPWHTQIDGLWRGADVTDHQQMTLEWNGAGQLSHDFRIRLYSGRASRVITASQATGRMTVE